MRAQATTPSAIADLALRQARKELLRDLSQMADAPTATFLSRYLLTLLPLALAGGMLAWWPHAVTVVLFAIISGFLNALGSLMHEPVITSFIAPA
jgi:hypothetical protein